MIFDNLEKIVQGWKCYIRKDPVIEEIAIGRAKICSECSELSMAMNFYLYCKQCGCFIPAKIRSLNSGCPLNKWKPHLSSI